MFVRRAMLRSCIKMCWSAHFTLQMWTITSAWLYAFPECTKWEILTESKTVLEICHGFGVLGKLVWCTGVKVSVHVMLIGVQFPCPTLKIVWWICKARLLTGTTLQCLRSANLQNSNVGVFERNLVGGGGADFRLVHATSCLLIDFQFQFLAQHFLLEAPLLISVRVKLCFICSFPYSKFRCLSVCMVIFLHRQQCSAAFV